MRVITGTIQAAAIAAALSILSLPTFAAGSGGGSSNNQPAPSSAPKKIKCTAPKVAKLVTVNGVKKWKCVMPVSGVLPDKELYEQGYALAKEGQYEWALDVFAAIQNQQDPDVLNMQGYSHRKAGRLDVAITYYRKALELKPDFVRAREYLGEGYVAAGRIDLAQAELSQIKSTCGETCEEYQDLAKVIATSAN